MEKSVHVALKRGISFVRVCVFSNQNRNVNEKIDGKFELALSFLSNFYLSFSCFLTKTQNVRHGYYYPW